MTPHDTRIHATRVLLAVLRSLAAAASANDTCDTCAHVSRELALVIATLSRGRGRPRYDTTPEQAEYIRRMADQHASGVSLRRLTQQAIHDEVFGRRTLHIETVRRMIKRTRGRKEDE